MIKERFASLFPSFFFKSQDTIQLESSFVAELSEQSDQHSLLLQKDSLAEDELMQAASQTESKAREVSASITKACRETNPQFLRMGRELQEIYGAAMGLTSSIQSIAMQLSQSEEGKCCLDQAGFLVENAWQSLNGAQRNIENSLNHIHQLLGHLEKFASICDMITRIGLWFRVVGVNIEIECNSQNLSGDMFTGVSKEVNVLSREINQMVARIGDDLDSADSRLSSLASTSSASLVEIRKMSEKAEGIVRRSVEDIRKLLAETSTLIDTTTTKAQVIGKEVGEVVVGIQFHDSMSQRVEHIVEAFQDIQTLCEQARNTKASETLGSACIILDFQKKQLLNLREEIRTLTLTIQGSFQVICSEIRDMNTELAGSKLAGNVRRQSGANLFKPLQQGLQHLGGLLATGNMMIDALHHSAAETATVANHLLEMISGVKQIKEETHIKAINTIIMANHLGNQGKTIEVLAKEIRSLADQTGEMVEGVSVVQEDIASEVAALRESITQERATISVADLEMGVESMGESYQQMQLGISTVAQDTETLANQINAVADQLSFLEDLGAKMEVSIEQVEQMLETLAPWQHSEQTHDENILRLLARYTMEQERLVHKSDASGGQDGSGVLDIELFSDGTEEGKGSADNASFDDNVELF